MLEREAAQYASYPAYAANFARLGVEAIDTTLPQRGEDLAAGVNAYRGGVDELVLRASRRRARSTTSWPSSTAPRSRCSRIRGSAEPIP